LPRWPGQGLFCLPIIFRRVRCWLLALCAPIAYFIGLRFLSSRLYRTTIRHALRQGGLLALCILLNLILLALHSWNIVTAIVIFIAAIIIEVVSLARK
jgi:hypothetical protein